MAGHLKGSFAGVRLAGDFDGTFVPSTRIVQEDEVMKGSVKGRSYE